MNWVLETSIRFRGMAYRFVYLTRSCMGDRWNGVCFRVTRAGHEKKGILAIETVEQLGCTQTILLTITKLDHYYFFF